MRLRIYGDWLTALIRNGDDSARRTVAESLGLTDDQLDDVQAGRSEITGDSESGLSLDTADA